MTLYQLYFIDPESSRLSRAGEIEARDDVEAIRLASRTDPRPLEVWEQARKLYRFESPTGRGFRPPASSPRPVEIPPLSAETSPRPVEIPPLSAETSPLPAEIPPRSTETSPLPAEIPPRFTETSPRLSYARLILKPSKQLLTWRQGTSAFEHLSETEMRNQSNTSRALSDYSAWEFSPDPDAFALPPSTKKV